MATGFDVESFLATSESGHAAAHGTGTDRADQIFDSSELRLARALLLLADRGQESGPRPISAPITHETLAGIVGTTRPRVSQFMSRFRKLGYISYDGGLRVHSSLLAVLLPDSETALPPA